MPFAKSKAQNEAIERIKNSKLSKADRRGRFLIKLAERRGEILEESPCQGGHEQVVREVKEMGNVYFYTSGACAGCPIGRKFINKYKEGQEDVPEEETHGCPLVENNVLVSLEPVQPGDVVTARPPNYVDLDNIQP